MKKIMFNDRFGLTEAVLSERKTQTRRIMKGKPLFHTDEIESASIVGDVAQIIANGGESLITLKLPYKVGEVVAIAQSYGNCGCFPDCKFDEGGYPIMPKNSGFFNKMFVRADLMPNHILITDVKVERLQDISDEDCIKEGIIAKWHAPGARNLYYIPNKQVRSEDDIYLTPHEAYAAMIDRISGKGTWKSNPYVFVYDFELVD